MRIDYSALTQRVPELEPEELMAMSQAMLSLVEGLIIIEDNIGVSLSDRIFNMRQSIALAEATAARMTELGFEDLPSLAPHYDMLDSMLAEAAREEE